MALPKSATKSQPPAELERLEDTSGESLFTEPGEFRAGTIKSITEEEGKFQNTGARVSYTDLLSDEAVEMVLWHRSAVVQMSQLVPGDAFKLAYGGKRGTKNVYIVDVVRAARAKTLSPAELQAIFGISA